MRTMNTTDKTLAALRALAHADLAALAAESRLPHATLARWYYNTDVRPRGDLIDQLRAAMEARRKPRRGAK